MRPQKLILLLLAIAALTPYFLLCFYALPYADDFCTAWTASEKVSFTEKFLKQYLYWNGRYSANILSNLHPLVTGKLFLYQVSLFASLLLTLLALLGFVRRFIENFYASLIAALFITLFYLCYMPDITEGVYWYMGIVNYQLGNVCVIFQLILFSKLLSSEGTKKIFSGLVSILLLIISIGFNEIGAILIPSFYLLATIVSYRLKARWRLLVAVFFITALAASAFVIFSPGNAGRSEQFAHRYKLLPSLWYATLQTIRFTATWVLSVPFIGLSLLAVAFADKIKNRFIRQFDYRLLLMFLLFMVYIASFIPYFTMGMLGQHRTINYAFFYFILLWLWFLISVSEKFSLYQMLPFLKAGNRAFIIAVVCIIFMAFSTTGRHIIYDFSNGNFTAYRMNFMERQDVIMAHPDLAIKPLKNVPASFKITDARQDSTWFVNKCMKKFYTETGMELK